MEEEQPQNRATSVPQPPSSNTRSIAPSTSSSLPSAVSQPAETGETEVTVQREEDHQQPVNGTRRPRRQNPRGFPFRIRGLVSYFRSSEDWNDVWSCLIVLLTFCSFASMTVILGFYGSFSVELGPNSSYLVEASPLFVRYIKAEQDDKTSGSGPKLFGFHESPSLDVETIWSQKHNASVAPYLYKDWMYYLNAGSHIEVCYEVKFPSSVPLFLVIAEGRESLLNWVDDPSYPNSTLSWKIIYGAGKIQQDIVTSDTYYVAVGNLNSDTTVVQLNVTVHSLMYNTSNADFRCSLSSHMCRFRLHLFKPNAVILATPGSDQVKSDEGWYIEVSFVAQWITYVCGTCIITILILATFRLCNLCQSNGGEDSRRAMDNGENQEPLLSPKDGHRSSWGSSYESIPNDEDDLDEKLLEGYPGGGQVSKDGEATNANNVRGLCVVCFDAPRDCFFLPCGHCATCFSCGTRIAEEAATCPICRRKMKKVRKIFAV